MLKMMDGGAKTLRSVSVIIGIILVTGLIPYVSAEGSLQLQWSYNTGSEVVGVVLSENGEVLAALSGGKLYFFVRENQEPMWFAEVGTMAQSISMTPDGKFIAVEGGYKVHFFNNQGNELWSNHLFDEWVGVLTSTDVEEVAISSDGNYVAAVGSYVVNLFSSTGTRVWYAYGNPSDPGTVRRVAISGDGSRVVVGGRDGKINLFDRNGKWLTTKSVSSYGIQDVAISEDGTYVLAIASDFVKLYTGDSLNELWSDNITDGREVAITPDLTKFVVGKWEEVSMFELQGSTPSLLWSKPVGGVNEVDISPDGSYVAVAGNAGVYLFDSAGNQIGFYSTTDIVESASVSRGGYVGAGLYAKRVLLFSTNTPPELSNPKLSPISGNENTEFTYRVTYRDADGDAPSYVRVYIDSTPNEMIEVSGDYSSGAIFEYTTTLPAGTHEYYFEAKDIRGAVVRLPETGVEAGPTVVSEGEAPPHETTPSEERPAGIPTTAIASGVIVLLVVVLLAKKFLIAGGAS